MIEAMACGTPVLAMRRGSVEEVVEHGLTGHIVDSIEEAIVTLPRVIALDRPAVHRRFDPDHVARSPVVAPPRSAHNPNG
jgi:glycosyltransferase involved in cell wall biosynthesis